MVIVSQNESHRKWQLVLLHLLLSALLVQANSGCGAAQRMGRIEPQYIAVQNLSAHNIENLCLVAPTQSVQKGTRYASISPVPKGVMQSARRPTGAPKLQNRIEVRWETEQNGEYAQVVDFKSVLSNAEDVTEDHTLVFRIRPYNSIEAKIEQLKR